ncbi:coiled-coil domain-containing protein 150 isoform X4 [Hemicordylus capensis]|uniref:coiled-coil domain-containing protein 150 isoform X4 n=1 Tax=Hemicordylus capensis TaxID=884348 RepID=UPI002302863B|nr:coiled-coil domain-containing protein 150 isoform X4 [Hemicordylus capensis]
MARPIISPMSVSATTPETVVVLDQRMRVVEEQTNALLRDLEKLGVNGDSMELFPSKPLENWDGHRSISPVHARVAFVGKNDTLWRTCETLVNRMCRLESVVQTLKLNMFRLQTEKELNPKHAANLEQRLNTIQEEHIQELKVLQTEGRTLYQQLSESREEEGKARDQVQRLSAALEIATAAKRDVAIAAEELKVTNNQMSHKLKELKEHLSKERSMRETLEESQAVLLYRMQDMEVTVEKERKQVHILQQDSSSLRQDIQIIQEKLLKEEERTVQLEQECIQLKADLESRETTISRLSEEGKAVQVSFSKEHEENLQLRSEITALRDVAEKVQVLNEQLDQQCAELNGTLQSVTMEKAKLISDHQAALKAEQDKISQKLQEQDLLLDAARASIMEELQIVQNEKARLQREIEALHAEHADCKQRACQVEESTATQKELLESTVARLRSELEAALQEKDSLLKEKEKLGEEMQKTIHERTQENNKLEAELTEKKLEIDPLKDTLKILEEENKNLLEREAAMKHQQHAQQQVDQVLAELTDNKNKLAYEKGKLQTQSVLVCTEEEFSNAVQSRDEALKENQKIKGQISAIEERGKHKVATLRRKVEEAKQDNFKMTTMLENVLASHNKMQVALEKVQTELGRKDSEIAGLRKDRTQFQQRIQKLEEELEHCHSKLVLETQHSMKIDPLRKALECSKADNKKLLQNLEQTRQTNSVLQSKLILVQDELESKEAEYQQLLECRDQLIEESKLEAKLYGERIETLKKQFQTEREAAKKAAHKESSELKKALEEACSKSSEMSRSNRELRAKVTELDEALASQKAKLKRQKAVIARYFNSKADNAERIKEIESELRQMEEMKQQYQKKNYEQSLSIKEFVSELTSLQSEMQELAKNQQEVAKENQNLESQLEAERKQRKQLVEHCQTLEDTVRHLKKCKEDTEQKLKEASVESEQISANLEEAHRWFKSKFENLQHELAKRRPLEIPCEQDDKEEKPVKLPSQACLKRWETKHHLKFVSKKYLNELKK